MRDPKDKRPATEDISITARVRAEEVRFKRRPDTETRFWGNRGLDTVSGTERENIPYEVRPGERYRDVRVRLVISGALDADSGETDD